MIRLDAASARANTERGKVDSRVVNVTFEWSRGVLAVLGSRRDGTTALLEVLAGLTPVRGGAVLVDGKPPADSRRVIAHVSLDPALPDALRVEEVCELASRLRGEGHVPAASRLEPLGIERLASRRVRSLSQGEARAVSLAIALSSSAKVLLLEDPLAQLEPAATRHVAEALRARGAAGAAVVLTTASVRDATSLADQLGVLTLGAFAHLPPVLAHVGLGGAKLRVVVGASATSDVAPLVAELTEEPAITSIETAAFAATRVLHAAVTLHLGGPDLLAVARAVQRAAAKTGAGIEAIESAVIPLAAIHARVAPPRAGVLPGAAAAASVAPSSSPPSAPPPQAGTA